MDTALVPSMPASPAWQCALMQLARKVDAMGTAEGPQ
jgi:hypothetical protein